MSLRARLSRISQKEAPPTEDDRAEVLAELRERMRRVLERAVQPRKPPPVDRYETGERLPFFAEETELGVRHRRVIRLGRAHRTGRAPVHAARDADGKLLSLLALDPSLAGAPLDRALYVDTETTGLSGGTGTVPFLVGIAAFDQDGLFVEQLLVRNLGEEAPMLAYLRERIEAASMLITFNGKTFDMPLLRTRFLMARMPPPPDRPHLDLLHVARRVHKRNGEPVSVRLTSLEDWLLGYERLGDVPSGEVSGRYLHFLRTGDESALLGVVEHNAQDVITMAALVGVYGEPLEASSLRPADLVSVAQTLRRAGDSKRAFAVATLAKERGAGPASLRARAEIARASGDRNQALADLEELLAGEADEDLAKGARLALAKLYEHHVKEPARALLLIDQGVAEDEPARSRRRRRLERKIAAAGSSRQAGVRSESSDERQTQAQLFVRKA
ncbi:MAG TPA: ribonuclease H-like domain-containing protein [Polyangiaceae bacterium]|nr:ribonuclease H-like domain-containing protein [Polyangiaceae bacterium]